MENKRKTGSRYEECAAAFLEERGICILERNFRCGQGEIDLIGREENTIVFFEVKYRKTNSWGNPAEAVDTRKQCRISRAADVYRKRENLYGDISFRFDVIAILDGEITWYRNAFEYKGRTLV